MSANTPRSPGRPPAGSTPASREALLRTAAPLFADQGYEGTSLKQVADGAGVTPAMIAYHFRDKAGLLEAVVLESLEHVLEAVRAAAAATGEDEAFAPQLVRSYLAVIDAHPWIPRIMVREVLSRDTPLRDLVRDRFMARAVRIVPPRLARDITEGRLRSDLDPVHFVLSLLGMCIFPYIAAPVLGPLLGYRVDGDFADEYADHAVRMILSGTGARP